MASWDWLLWFSIIYLRFIQHHMYISSLCLFVILFHVVVFSQKKGFMNKAFINILYRFLFKHKQKCISLGWILKGWSCWIAWYLFNFIKNWQTIYQGDVPMSSYQQRVCSNCLTSLSALGIATSFYFSLSSKRAIVSHSGFNFISLMTNDVDCIWRCLVAIYISLLVKYLWRSFAPF